MTTLELWNSDDCATFLRCSRRQFMERIRPVPTFPHPKYLPTIEGSSRPLWHAADVRAWAVAHLQHQKHEAPAYHNPHLHGPTGV